MKPFKFFFTAALALMAFLFLARVFFAAFLIAGVMSIGYFFFRKVTDFFRYRNWRGHDERYAYFADEDQTHEHRIPGLKFDNDLLVDDCEQARERVFAERIIPVR